MYLYIKSERPSIFSETLLKTPIFDSDKKVIGDNLSQNLKDIRLDPLSQVLAVLIAENEEYAYVDKLGYVVSSDLAVYYLREALRDFSSIMNKTKWNNSQALSEAKKIRLNDVEKIIDYIAELNDPREIRRVVSLIAAKALAKANALKQIAPEKKERERP